MLELREYKATELAQILKTNTKQALDRKLESWGITFTSDERRGENRKYTLTAIENPFKIYCITELNIDSHTDFYKLQNCFYYFLNDPEFRDIPDEMREDYTEAEGKKISRQSISKYIKHLSKNELVLLNSAEYNHYFAYQDFRIFTDEKTYKEAWNLYWQLINEAKEKYKDDYGEYSSYAISEVVRKYGGVPRKQPKPSLNGIYNSTLKALNELVCDEIEKEVKIKLEN